MMHAIANANIPTRYSLNLHMNKTTKGASTNIWKSHAKYHVTPIHCLSLYGGKELRKGKNFSRRFVASKFVFKVCITL